MKGMPGMEGIKMFTADDLKNMNPDQMGNMFSGGGGGRQRPKRQTRSQYRRRLVNFYETYGLHDKVAGVDAALDKWKGREEKMFDVLNKKYADVISAHYAAETAKWEAEDAERAAEEQAARTTEEEMDAAFQTKQEL
eukprot:CAMPEP_0119309788 /NCGR_PEP_ID=MMETSP1333-20130426/16792_1 /TAXON_ID=418940 /ORGANISM="Scyphosphaera apsteinii, Strain RCC1455" /LENGTH=136 /DNA_ID=CAMNT_0007313827 /DNA_START=160 /DNA_END=570 /DNA_ORIENTATION=+